MSNTREKVVHPPMCICVICDAEAAVIAAAERVVEGWHYVNHGKQLEPSRIEREADLTTAVRALLEARKP